MSSAAGLASLLGAAPVIGDPTLAEAAETFSRRLAYGSTALFYAILVLQRKFFHRTPDHISSSATLSALYDKGNAAQLGVAAVLVFMPFLIRSSGLPLHLR